MARVLGEGLVRVRPTNEGFASELGQQMGSGQVAGETKKSGSKIGKALGTALKASAAVTVAAAGGFLATALTKGFSRLNAIDQANAKLQGLGLSAAKAAAVIAGPVTKAVMGTAFGLDEAASTAAGAMASGIKSSTALTKYLSLVGDAASQAGISFNDMGQIMNKVQGQGKLTGDVVQQMAENGLYVMPMLAKAFKLPQAEMQKLVSEGKVSSAEFRRVLEQNIGGAALKSGATFTGAWKNLMASVGRIGAGLLSGVFPHLAPTLTKITQSMKPLELLAGKIGDKIGKVLAPALENAVPYMSRLGDINLSSLAAGASGVGTAFGKVGEALRGIDWSAVQTAFGKGASDTVSVFSVVIGFLADHLDELARVMPALIVAFGAYKLAQVASSAAALFHLPIQAANTTAMLLSASANKKLAAQMAIANGVQTTSTLGRVRNTLATVTSTVASIAAATATRAMAAAQRILNAVMKANPLGLVITALVGVAAGLVYAYKKSETFRRIVNGAFSLVRRAIAKVVDGVAGLMGMFAKMLRVLAKAPGFGWAKGAADAMDKAARKAHGLAGAIRGIKSPPPIRIQYQYFTGGKPPVGPGVLAPRQLPHLATGGRVTRPTLAMIGDGREPETVMNDTMLSKALQRAAEAGRDLSDGTRQRVRGAITNNFTVNTADPMAAARESARLFAFAGV